IVEQSHDHAEMLTHGTEHAQREIGSPSQELDEIVFWHKQNSRRLGCARIRGVTSCSCEGRFGKRFDGAKHMDHLLLPSRVDAIHVDRAPLHDIKSFTTVAFAKKIFLFVEMLWNDERGNGHDISCGQADEELTAAQRIFSYRLPELAGFQRHAAI